MGIRAKNSYFYENMSYEGMNWKILIDIYFYLTI